MENKRPRKSSAYIHRSAACIRRHGPTHIIRVSETYEMQVFCINVEVWNKSHIIWEPFQTPIFSLYKAYMAPFQNTQKILKENLRFTRNSESKREFFTKHP